MLVAPEGLKQLDVDRWFGVFGLLADDFRTRLLTRQDQPCIEIDTLFAIEQYDLGAIPQPQNITQVMRLVYRQFDAGVRGKRGGDMNPCPAHHVSAG